MRGREWAGRHALPAASIDVPLVSLTDLRPAVRGLAAALVPIAAAGSLAAAQAPPHDPIERRAVPPDGVITITDFGYRDWAPEPVGYSIDPRRHDPARLSVRDPQGRPVPVQIENGVLTFMASVGEGGTARYTVEATPSTAASALSVRRSDAYLEARNEHLAIRLPPPGEQRYGEGVSADEVPGPLLAWTDGGERFAGGTRLHTARRIVSTSFSVVRSGPVVFEYDARYRFDPEGAYRFNLRLSPGMPLATVTEEFDFGDFTAGEDQLLLDLHRGWQPDRIHVIQPSGERPLPVLETFTPADYRRRAASRAGTEASVGGAGAEPRPHAPWAGAVLLDKIVPGGRWGEFKGGVMAAREGSDGPGRSGLVPLHVGAWRRAMALNVWLNPQGGASVALPISVRRLRWPLDIADDFSPFSTHEHDEGLPATYGRRVWGLYTGAEFELAQPRYGYIGLDRYKDWLVDYPEGPTSYPGVFFSPRHVEMLKAHLGRHPDREDLGDWFLFSGDNGDAERHARLVIDRLGRARPASRFFLAGLSHYRQSQSLSFVMMAEDALADRSLAPALRRELRLRLALHANLMSEPDFNPRGSGVHLGNNNMTINRTLALTYFAGLLQDHPRHRYWMDRVERFLRFKFATQTSPDGPWIAAPNYQLYSPTRTMIVSQNALRNLGFHDFSEDGYLFATLRYLAQLAVPDVRFGNRHVIPGMGNSSNRIESIWGLGMAAVFDRHPGRAAYLRRAFLAAKGDAGGILRPATPPGRVVDDVESYALYYLPWLRPADAASRTTLMPSYGAVLRHGGGAGTALLLRAGMNWSHWDTDALNVILYSRGVPLSPGTAYVYYSGAAAENSGIYHNRVKLGRRDLQEVFGRVDGAIADYGFGPHADYAVAERYYPSQLFADGEGPAYWRRHVMLVKTDGAAGDYFVMRDTFPGAGHMMKWWNWLNLGHADNVSVEGTAFARAEVPFNRTVDDGAMPELTGHEVEMKTGFGASTWFWFRRNRQVRARMTMEYPRADGLEGTETKTVIEIPAGPGEDYLYLVYPRHGADPLPAVRALADGVLEVTRAGARDTVFIGDRPFEYERDGVVFTGKAGMVRVLPDREVLVMSAGSGRIGRGGRVVEGAGPFEHVVDAGSPRPGLHRRAAGYDKLRRRVDLGRGVVVDGEAPFSARLEGDRVVVDTDGRQRVLFVSQPDFITRPRYTIDGREWMASWTDYPNSGWGQYDETWKIGLSVPAGRHRLVVDEMTFPAAWTRGFEPGL